MRFQQIYLQRLQVAIVFAGCCEEKYLPVEVSGVTEIKNQFRMNNMDVN